jgi:hypothetical protein
MNEIMRRWTLKQFRVNEFHGSKLKQGLIFGQTGRDRNAKIRRVSRFEMTAPIDGAGAAALEPSRGSQGAIALLRRCGVGGAMRLRRAGSRCAAYLHKASGALRSFPENRPRYRA